MYFKDRTQAGELLAKKLLEKYDHHLKDPVVIAIPRGGVVVADIVAQKLRSQLDIVIPRKIGAPFNKELAIGAVTEGGMIIMDSQMREFVTDENYIRKTAEKEIEEIKRRKSLYLKNREHIPVEGRDIILVDDGIATGLTVKAAIASLRSKKPFSIILAVPVMPPERKTEMEKLVDDVVVIYTPSFFAAVGQFYQDFSQTTDEEVINILKKYDEQT